MKIISRKSAQEQGLKRYFTGKPCKHGHVSARMTNGGCVDCAKKYTKRWYKENPTKKSEYDKKYYGENCEDIIAYNREYYANNKTEILDKMHDYYNKNSDWIKTRQQAYHHANIDKHRAYYLKNKKKLYQQNKDWYTRNKEHALHLQRKRRRANSKYTQYDRLYKAMRQQAKPAWLTESDLDQIEKLYQKARRLTAETGVKHTVDHIYPIKGETMCGLHVPDNLQILTHSENSSKGNRV